MEKVSEDSTWFCVYLVYVGYICFQDLHSVAPQIGYRNHFNLGFNLGNQLDTFMDSIVSEHHNQKTEKARRQFTRAVEDRS